MWFLVFGVTRNENEFGFVELDLDNFVGSIAVSSQKK